MKSLIQLATLISVFTVGGTIDRTPIIQTPLGKIQGQYKLSLNKNQYAAYEGVRYAQPPIGHRRFKESEMVRPWSGVWDATHRHTCLQPDMMDPKLIWGEEDCLFLNIYVPKKVKNIGKLNVLVDIHGGAFMYNSGHAYTRPDYVMDRQIVFVSINYRLNLFGFLSTGDAVIPGNNGLKDQVMALRWIQNNIDHFGGNGRSVTIMGYSAGGASVHYHLLSPMSTGLFHKAIVQGATALNPWALQKNPLKYTAILAQGVGCDFKNNRDMLTCLKQRPWEHLVEQYPKFFDYAFLPISPFGPVVEKKAPDAFLDKEPYVLYRKGQIYDVPLLQSHTNNEGLFFVQMLPGKMNDFEKRWEDLAPALLNYNHSNAKQIARSVREFYMGDKGILSNDIADRMLSDRYMLNDGEIAIRFIAKYNKSPVYYYIFSYTGDDNTIYGGIPHGHDLQYWFTPYTHFFEHSAHSSDELKMKDFMVDLFTGFADTGNPNATVNAPGLNWEPVTFDDFNVLNLTTYDTSKLKMQYVDQMGARDFWDTLNLMENQHTSQAKDEL